MRGINNTIHNKTTSSSSSNEILGINSEITNSSITNPIKTITGIKNTITHNGLSDSDGSVYGIINTIDLATNTTTGTITNVIGEQIKITKPVNTTVTNAIGLEINDITTASVENANYAIKTGKGIVKFGDIVKAKEIQLEHQNPPSPAPTVTDLENIGKIRFSGGKFEINDGNGWKQIQTQ